MPTRVVLFTLAGADPSWEALDADVVALDPDQGRLAAIQDRVALTLTWQPGEAGLRMVEEVVQARFGRLDALVVGRAPSLGFAARMRWEVELVDPLIRRLQPLIGGAVRVPMSGEGSPLSLAVEQARGTLARGLARELEGLQVEVEEDLGRRQRVRQAARILAPIWRRG